MSNNCRSLDGWGTRGLGGLKSPTDVAAHPGGGFLIVDCENHRVLRVHGDGDVTLVAGRGTSGSAGGGGAAVRAELDFPHCVAVHPWDGSVFITEHGDKVRRVDRRGTATYQIPNLK
eukprot:gene18106-biopygen38546